MSRRAKTLYLVRHAKSSWDDPSLSDRDRPLNKRGKRDAPDMGQRLREQGHRPDHVISSPARRARSTALKITRELGLDEAAIEIADALYFKGLPGMYDTLERVDDRHASVMLVGHNPTMTDMLNRLTGAGIYNMPTCAIAIVEFDMESWGLARTVEAQLAGYDYPKGDGSFDY